MKRLALAAGLLLLPACSGHGSIAENISAPLGEPLPGATAEQLAAFERGKAVSLRRFQRADGLGPAFNVTFCGACHERPVPGGSAGLYRNFFIAAVRTEDGALLMAESAGPAGGVQRLVQYGEGLPERPFIDPDANVFGQRNPIPFFGVGLLAELPEDVILANADPDDADGDGISGRPNYDRGFVGRFGRKAQTVSIEGFIRGPLFNHLGITTDPLDDAQRAALPVDSSGGDVTARRTLFDLVSARAQVAAPSGPTTDEDGVPDPELSTDDLFDLVSFAMLLAAPAVEQDPQGDAAAGRDRFDDVGCGGCHVPRLEGPRGNLPLYSDLLLHDLGEDLADGLVQGEALGNEFRTQPLWGLAATGPYLHDGRAFTIDEAIDAHGGEAEASRDAWRAATDTERSDLHEFLLSLGGRDQFTPGQIPAGSAVPSPGEWGGPVAGLDATASQRFEAGRTLFDTEFGSRGGVGGPRMNGDSCRACHFEPVVGGAGPRGVNVMRHGILNADGEFTPPAVGTILHRTTSLRGTANRAQPEANVFEARQTPHLFGLGLLESVPRGAIEALADPDDLDGDGVSGRVSIVDGGRLGRFGWKAQVPSLAEFVRDAVTAELGMTLPAQEGLTFGLIHDNDEVADPEMTLDQAGRLLDYLALLGPPPQTSVDPQLEARGAQVFADVGCDACHRALPGPDGPVEAYTDLLLHEVLPPDSQGIEEASANVREFRTAPLWGLGSSAPYLHDGRADTIEQAIEGHAGEADASRVSFGSLPADDRAALLAFLASL